MNTIDVFKDNKEERIRILKELKDLIIKGKELGVDIEEYYIEKLDTSISEISNEKLKVSLVGEYSAGKTSLLSAWLGYFDKSKMKILPLESSDTIQIYDTEDIQIVDTPGLYGYKYKETTRKYISNSHLILYVMEPSAPIKDSHKEELLWIFNDLKLIDRTVFVIGRFDQEVDLDFEDEYIEVLDKRKEEIKVSLTRMGITFNDINVVAVAANPYDKGMEYWFSNNEEFKRLSHIDSLKKATNDRIKEFGREELIKAKKESIISDVMVKNLPSAMSNIEIQKEVLSKISDYYSEMTKELSEFRRSINDSKNTLRKNFNNYYTNLILMLNGTSKETLSDFIEKQLGSDFRVMIINSEDIWYREMNKFEDIQLKSINTFNRNMEYVNESSVFSKNKQFIETAIGMAKLGASNVKVTADFIKGTRDFIGIALKFKPWGAIKLANRVNNFFSGVSIALPVVTVGIEMFSQYDEMNREKEFQNYKQKIKNLLEKDRSEIDDFLIGDDFENGFEIILDLRARIEYLKNQLEITRIRIEETDKWLSEMKKLEIKMKY